MKHHLLSLLKERILIMDGAMGTMIQRYKLEESDFRFDRISNIGGNMKGNNDLLSISKPDIIQEIHYQYLKAGADIIETNTFSANTISQADYNLSDFAYEINVKSAQIARASIEQYLQEHPGEHKFVAGAIGPTNVTTSMSPDVNNPGYRAVYFDELCEAYKEQVEGLIDGGVDILLVETIFDTLNAKAALFAVQNVLFERNVNLPVMVSGTITDASGRTLSGQTTEAFLISMSHVPLLSIGLNCALGAEQLRPYLEVLSRKAPFHTSAYPNAGLPNEFGEYDQSPEEMANLVKEFAESGFLNIVGGCCGTTPDHIQAIANAVKGIKPRTVKEVFHAA